MWRVGSSILPVACDVFRDDSPRFPIWELEGVGYPVGFPPPPRIFVFMKIRCICGAKYRKQGSCGQNMAE